jgi:serine/threonine-protein kinase ULK2
MLENELKVIQRLKHKHIVAFIDVLHTSQNYYFVFEICKGGDLQGLLKKQPDGRINEFEAQRIFC